MKLTALFKLHPAKFLLAGLAILQAGAGRAVAEDSPSNPPEVKTTTRRIIIVEGANAPKSDDGKAPDATSGLRLPGDHLAKGASLNPTVWIGVSLGVVTTEVRAQLPLDEGVGVLVRDVITDGPAQKAGLQPNDVMTKFNDEKITDPGQFKSLVAGKKEGDVVRLGYYRRGREATVEVTLGRPPESARKPDLEPHSMNMDMKMTMPNFDLGDFPGGKDSDEVQVIIMDKQGKVLSPAANSGHDAVLSNVEKSLRDAGVAQEVIERTRKEVAEALEKTDARVKETLSKEGK